MWLLQNGLVNGWWWLKQPLKGQSMFGNNLYTFHWPLQPLYTCVCILRYHLQQTYWNRYRASISSWFTRKDCQGLSVSLWYAQKRALGWLFKHLGPRVLELPSSPCFFATKEEEMEEWELPAAAKEGMCVKSNEGCVRVQRLMRGWLFPTTSAQHTPWDYDNKTISWGGGKGWRLKF